MMENTALDENPDAGNLNGQINEGGAPAKPRRLLRLVLGRSLKCVGVLLLAFMIVDKLYDMKLVYYDEMSPYALDMYRQMVKFQRQFMSLGEGKSLESLVDTLGASYVGEMTSAQLQERMASENYQGAVDLRFLPTAIRRQYTGNFKYGCYTLPHLGDCTGKMLVRKSLENKLLDYVVVYE